MLFRSHSALKMGYSMEEIAAAVKDLNRVDWLDDRKESWKESLPVALLDTQTASMLATNLEEGEVADLEIEMGWKLATTSIVGMAVWWEGDVVGWKAANLAETRVFY